MCHPEVPEGLPKPDVRTEEVAIGLPGGERLPALLAVPERTPAPPVLVINDVFGRSAFYEHLTGRLALAGFVALNVEYFFRQGPVPDGDRPKAMARRLKLDQRQTLDDLEAAIAWLMSIPQASGSRLGTIGFCMGGTFVLDLAARRREAVSVSYYGFPGAKPDERNGLERPIDAANRMRAPILGHWGDQDTGVGMGNVAALSDGLRAARVEHEFHVYPGLGHGFLKAFLEDESAAGYAQACESWTRTLDFYRRHLLPGGGRA
ncbi:MAG TPA: dienelactone hydrolase family protein [Candidatus Limnocylindrales bacterium]|nr:dienelactone hydrolase family protein [Candidatus Limnocylindrales bacterium]